MAERMSAMKASGEDDMAYFERRYQERVTFFYVVYNLHGLLENKNQIDSS